MIISKLFNSILRGILLVVKAVFNVIEITTIFNPGIYRGEPGVVFVRKSVPPLTYEIVVPPVPKYPPTGILILALKVFKVKAAPDGIRFGKGTLTLIFLFEPVRKPIQGNCIFE